MLINDCGWKDGDSGDSAAKNLLTPTGLLMEGDYAQSPSRGILSVIAILQQPTLGNWVELYNPTERQRPKSSRFLDCMT